MGDSKLIGTMHYLAIIRKADFVDLFKYGKLNVYSAISFDGNVMDHANDEDLFAKLTKEMNLFEYSFVYMIIHFISDNGNVCPIPVSIKKVIGLYTFDEEAKKEMSISLDHRIKLQVSPWSEKFKALYQRRQVSQNKRGIDNLWAIFKLSEDDRKRCESIITDDIVDEVFDELFSYKRPAGEQSIWTYLLRYERHSFYPKNMKGYFCDYIHVACNWLSKNEIQEDVAKTTEVYSQIIDCPEDRFESLSGIAVDSKLPHHTDGNAGCKFAIAAPLFLYMKDRYRDGYRIEQNIIDYAKKFGFECSVAVYLLGLTLGYDKTYDAYYDFDKLPIFEEPVIKAESSDENEATHHDIPKQGTLFQDTSNDDKEKQPVWLYKGRKENYSVAAAFDEDEIKCLKDKGYKVLKSISKKAEELIRKQGYKVLTPEGIKQKQYGDSESGQ